MELLMGSYVLMLLVLGTKWYLRKASFFRVQQFELLESGFATMKRREQLYIAAICCSNRNVQSILVSTAV